MLIGIDQIMDALGRAAGYGIEVPRDGAVGLGHAAHPPQGMVLREAMRSLDEQ